MIYSDKLAAAILNNWILLKTSLKVVRVRIYDSMNQQCNNSLAWGGFPELSGTVSDEGIELLLKHGMIEITGERGHYVS